MAPSFEFVLFAGFAVLMIGAAISDFRRLVIPNAVVVALCFLWPLHFGSLRGAGLGAAFATVASAAAVFFGGAALFARGLLGGGDVKLLAAASLWAGVQAVPALLLATALIGGLLALVFLTPLARLSGAAGHACEPPQDKAGAFGGAPIPYGVAIAIAALIVTLPPWFS